MIGEKSSVAKFRPVGLRCWETWTKKLSYTNAQTHNQRKLQYILRCISPITSKYIHSLVFGYGGTVVPVKPEQAL